MKTSLVILALFVLMGVSSAQTDPANPNMPPPDVQALASQLSSAGCQAALNAASTEIIKLRKQVAELQAQQMQGKSGPTKH